MAMPTFDQGPRTEPFRLKRISQPSWATRRHRQIRSLPKFLKSTPALGRWRMTSVNLGSRTGVGQADRPPRGLQRRQRSLTSSNKRQSQAPPPVSVDSRQDHRRHDLPHGGHHVERQQTDIWTRAGPRSPLSVTGVTVCPIQLVCGVGEIHLDFPR